MSGFGAPARTASPRYVCARSRSVPATIRRSAIRSFNPARFMITTSAGTPRRSWFPIVFGPFPGDPPVVVVTVTPEDFSNSGRSFPYAAENPPEIMTFTWPEDEAGTARMATATTTAATTERQLLHMAFDLLG